MTAVPAMAAVAGRVVGLAAGLMLVLDYPALKDAPVVLCSYRSHRIPLSDLGR